MLVWAYEEAIFNSTRRCCNVWRDSKSSVMIHNSEKFLVNLLG